MSCGQPGLIRINNLSLLLFFSNFFYTFQVRPSPSSQIWPLTYNCFSTSSLIPKSHLFKQVTQVCLPYGKSISSFICFRSFSSVGLSFLLKYQCTVLLITLKSKSSNFLNCLMPCILLLFFFRTWSLLCIFVLFNYSFYWCTAILIEPVALTVLINKSRWLSPGKILLM